MTSLAPTAAEQPPIFHAETGRTPLQAAVASELGEELADSGFLVLPSQLEGFVQTGAPLEEREVVDFGTYRKLCPTAVTVRTVPGELVTADAAPMICPACGGAMERHGDAAIMLWHFCISPTISLTKSSLSTTSPRNSRMRLRSLVGTPSYSPRTLG